MGLLFLINQLLSTNEIYLYHKILLHFKQNVFHQNFLYLQRVK